MRTRCSMGRNAGGSPTFTNSVNYINKNGDHPIIMDCIDWNRLVFKKEELNDHNWLYIGDATQEERESQIWWMKEIEGWLLIIE